jgi:hypothetical protein
MSSNTDTKNVELQLKSMQGFIDVIQSKQIEHALKLSKQKTIVIGKNTYHKKPLSASKWREISKLNNEMANLPENSPEQLDKLIELRTKGADYYFGIPPDIFDENYEKLNPIIEGCILRSNTGLSPEVDLDKLLVEYQNLTQKSS